MGFNRNNGGEIKYKIGKVDEILEEKGNQFTALREESFDDGEKYYTAIRRFYTDNDGKENMGKGVTFLTPEGPAAAAVSIIKSGFGTTTEYLETLKTREDFDASLNEVLGEDDPRYDPNIKSPVIYDASDFIDDDDEEE